MRQRNVQRMVGIVHGDIAGQVLIKRGHQDVVRQQRHQRLIVRAAEDDHQLAVGLPDEFAGGLAGHRGLIEASFARDDDLTVCHAGLEIDLFGNPADAGDDFCTGQ